jgi:hypothetical protein
MKSYDMGQADNPGRPSRADVGDSRGSPIVRLLSTMNVSSADDEHIMPMYSANAHVEHGEPSVIPLDTTPSTQSHCKCGGVIVMGQTGAACMMCGRHPRV